MITNTVADPLRLFESWLRCPIDASEAWLDQHESGFSLALLWLMKERSADNLLTDPTNAKAMAQGMFAIAGRMVQEPLALAVAAWAQGNAVAYDDPQQAILWYQRALADYRLAHQPQEVLGLLANLLYVTSEIDLQAAWQIYEEIEAERAHLSAVGYPLQLRIEQNVGILLHRLGHYREAVATNERALAIAQANAQQARIAEIKGNQALIFGSMGRFDECEQYLVESRALAQTTGNQLTAARMAMNLGELAAILGKPGAALTYFHEARTGFAEVDNQMEIGSVALREARLLERIGAFAQARRAYTLAGGHFQRLQMWPQVWQATYEGAMVNRRYGAFPQAASLLSEASHLWQRHQQAVWQADWQLEAAALALAQADLPTAQQMLAAWQATTPAHLKTAVIQARHDLLWAELWANIGQDRNHETAQEEARQAFQQALDYAEAHGELPVKRQALVGLGRLLRQRNPAIARQLLLAAAEQDDLIRAGLSAQELKANFLNQSSDVLENLLGWTIEDKQPIEALLLSWRVKGSALRELLQSGREITIDEPLQTKLLTVRNRLAALHWHAAVEANRRGALQAAVEQTMPEIAQLEQQLIELRRQRQRKTSRVQTIDLDAAVAALAQSEADLLIEYVRVDDQLFANVVEQDGACRLVHLSDNDTILDFLSELTLSFQSILTLPYPAQNWTAFMDEGRRLLALGYDRLIRPLAIPTTSARLLIAPCTQLHRVPFAALWDGVKYLVESYTIELTPTGALLGLPTPVAPLTQPLVIASSATGLLPANREQAEAIRQIYPTATYLIDDAGTLAYLQSLTIAPRFVHITAHTIMRESNPIFTAMHLTNGTLSVEACYELPLYGTELVILSSCTTNIGMESDGALLAFQSAFFAAGAQRVLTTLWEIHSDVTRQWLALFYARLRQGGAPADTLRQTQLAFLRNDTLCHPVFWAAFACSRR